jgi:hypothetical protein
MIVVAGGMIRSGSTFAFNIVRELLSLTGPVRTYSANQLDTSELDEPGAGHVVVKSHSPDSQLLAAIDGGSVRCVCTVRRPEDAIASWLRAFGFPIENGIEMVRQWLEWHGRVRDKVLTIDYRVIEEQPRDAAEAIVAYLKLDADSLWLERLLEKYEKSALKKQLDGLANDEKTVDIGFSYYDRETFFHRRHISSERSRGAEEDLTGAQLAQIRAAFAPR